MSGALFRTMLKTNAYTILSYALGMTLYQWLFIWVYPSLTKSSALNSLLQSLPQGMLQLIGYQSGVSQVSDFLAGEFYGLVYVIILAIYTVTTATKLMARAVDRGAMAYLLSTQVSRMKVALTQAAVLIVGVTVIGALTTAGGLLGVAWFVPKSGLDAGRFVEMNVVGILLFFVIGAYSFVFSSVSRDERTAAGVSAGLTMAFFALKTISALDNHLEWLKYLSIFTAFNPQDLVHGGGHFVSTSLLLALAAVVLFSIAIAGFRRRQMSL